MSEVKTVRLGALEHDPVALAGNEARLEKTDDLYASIPVKGVLQSLRVRPWDPAWPLPAATAPKGKGKKGALAQDQALPEYAVQAGNRRLRTLRRLRDEGGTIMGVVVTDDWPVVVMIGAENDADTFEITSTENLQRMALTPVEEFRAFSKMAEKSSVKEVAAHFGVTEKRVQQRMKLAALHPDVLGALDAGKISLEAAAAFTVEPDPQRQADYLKKARGSWDLNPQQIKQAFTDELVRSDTPIARLIGKDAYIAAGGEVIGDPFADTAYWISAEIIERLLDERVAALRATWADEGWLFVETAEEFGKDQWGSYKVHGAGRLRAEPAPLSPELQAQADELGGKIEALEAQMDEEEEYDPVKDEEHTKLSGQLEAIEAGAVKAFTTEQRATSGVVFWPDGSREPFFGVLRPGAREPGAKQAKPAADLNAPGDTTMLALSKVMTDALQEDVSAQYETGLQIIVAALHAKVAGDYGIPVKITGELKAPLVPATNPIGRTFGEALAWAGSQSIPALLVYLGELVGANIGVVRAGGSYSGSERVLIHFVDPPVKKFFDSEAYFTGLTKPLIVLAYADMTGGTPLGDRKKTDMVKEVAAYARDLGWLPPQLRTPSYVGPALKAPAPEETEELQQAAE